MSVEGLVVHFQYSGGDLMPDGSGGSGSMASSWSRQYYLPGEMLRGVVSLHIRGNIRVRDITLFLLGTATVSWEAPSKKKVYQSSEVHLESARPLLDLTQAEETIPLGQGEHRFGFQYQLPDDLPSTFNGVYGQVTYIAKVLLECEDERNTTITSEPFLVLRRPQLPESIYSEKTLTKKRFFMGLKSGRVRVECKIDKSAAVPGDDILVDGEITNYTGRRINLIQASLLQESKYIAQGHELNFRQYLSKRDDVYDVGREHGRRWTKVHLPVPPFLADSGLEKCKIMDVRYYFQFKVSIEGKDDVVVECPMYVGSHNSVFGPAGKDLLLGRMWNSMAIADTAQPHYDENRSRVSNRTGSFNWEFQDNRFYRNIVDS